MENLIYTTNEAGTVVYFKSRTASFHSNALRENPRACFAVYDHAAQYPDEHKTGVQIMGRVHQITDREEIEYALARYTEKFGDAVYRKSNLEELLSPDTQSTYYACVLESYKLVHTGEGIHMDEYENYE
jgi:nitroimidazol reductase NimA-like FMN-containing flavoprotein (pyridoxamine 5'-phosphate oxidase superfamily)